MRMWRRASRLQPLACVTGGRDLVRALGLAGIRCAILKHPGSLTRHSRFVKSTIDWVSPQVAPGRLVDELVRFGRSQAEKPILYYGNDWDLLLVSRHRERLCESFRFVLPDATLVEDLVDKARFQGLVEEHDLPVPASVQLSPSEKTVPPELELRFPLVVKPLTRRHETWLQIAEGKALRVDHRAALARVWPLIARAGVDVLAQEVVPGPESLVESYHVYVDANGVIAGEFTGRKIRTYPAEFGYSTAVAITDTQDVAELGRELTRRLQLRGVAKYDFKRDVDGELKLLEVNPRFNLWHYPGAKAGVNLPALVYDDLVGQPRRAVEPVRPGIRWCSPSRDVVAARAEGIGLLRWLRWAVSCEAKSVATWDDPIPFAVGGSRMLVRGVAASLTSSWNALRRPC